MIFNPGRFNIYAVFLTEEVVTMRDIIIKPGSVWPRSVDQVSKFELLKGNISVKNFLGSAIKLLNNNKVDAEHITHYLM